MSCSTSAAPFRANGIVVSEDREQRRNRVGAHPAKRVLGGRPHPPALVGEEPRDRRRRLGADARAPRRAPRGRGRTTRRRRDARSSAIPTAVSAARSERLDGCRAHVRVGVPCELDERRLSELGVGPKQRRPPEAHGGIRSRGGAERAALRARVRAARARRRSANAGRGRAGARRAGGRSPSRHRCRRACESQRPRSSDPESSRTGLISRGTAGWCACSRRWSARTRRHLPHSVRGRPRRASNEPLCGTSLSGAATAR